MCYSVKIEIVPEGVEEKAKKQFRMPQLPKKTKIAGEFPFFKLTDGYCGCGLVKKEGSAIADEIIPFVESLLSSLYVKRVNIIWYWINLPKNANKEKITIQEFGNRNQQKSLAEDVWFSINNPLKYQRKL